MKRKQGKEGNHERWLLSYADFITLLMIFFIVLYSSSNIDANKYKAISESLGISLGAGGTNPIDTGIDANNMDSKNQPSEAGIEDTNKEEVKEGIVSLESVKKEIEKYMKENGMEDIITTEINERGLVISLKDTVFFHSGKAQILPESKNKLVEIGKIINKLGNYIRVEGHTDNVPIRNSSFSSNWQLSAIRATNVSELMISESGILPYKISAVGYGEYRPVGDNNSPEGRAKNRRVNIAIIDTKFNGSEQK